MTRRLCLLLAVASLAAEHRSPNFIVTAPTEEVASKVAEAAEAARERLAVLWLGKEMPSWREPMPVRVALTLQGNGGATTFAFKEGKLLSQEMHLEGVIDRVLTDNLPHEIAHTVLAHHFRRPVPRWADEGAAVLAESASERKRHDQLVRQINAAEKRRIPLRRLFSMTEYPRDVMVLYAEGYSVTRFLVAAKDRKTFLAFVEQGMDGGWDRAAREHYGFEDVDALEAAWLLDLKQRTPPETAPAKAKDRCPLSTAPGAARGPGGLDRQALVAALLEAVRDPSGDVSLNACLALSALGREATPALIDALRHSDKEMRGKASYVLGHMGLKGRAAEAETALPALARMLKDDDVEVRKLASWAIRNIVSDGKEKGDE